MNSHLTSSVIIGQINKSDLANEMLYMDVKVTLVCTYVTVKKVCNIKALSHSLR